MGRPIAASLFLRVPVASGEFWRAPDGKQLFRVSAEAQFVVGGGTCQRQAHLRCGSSWSGYGILQLVPIISWVEALLKTLLLSLHMQEEPASAIQGCVRRRYFTK